MSILKQATVYCSELTHAPVTTRLTATSLAFFAVVTAMRKATAFVIARLLTVHLRRSMNSQASVAPVVRKVIALLIALTVLR